MPGVGAVNVMGAGDYSMRIWLDPAAMRIRYLSPAMCIRDSTNLDNAPGGVNFKIAEKIGLKNVRILEAKENALVKFTTFVPRTKHWPTIPN